MKYWVLLIILISVSLQTFAKSIEKKSKNNPYLIVLSLDAFRWDYPDIYNTPNLDSIAKNGVKVESLLPAFPSKTFPNHYTMATGLYPQNHGIVQNVFTDPILGDYTLGDRSAVQNGAFYGGEPIWVTAEQQGVKSACFYWPGSEAPIKGTSPSIWKKYDESIPFEARADSVISWLKKPSSDRPHLIMWYYEEPDGISHSYGPNSKETKQIVERIDSVIGDFRGKIHSLPFADSINIVFTADHGMAPISEDKSISIDEYIKDDWVKSVKGSNPVYLLQPKNNIYTDSIISKLSGLEELDCWEKTGIPEHLHYGNNHRIFEVVCAAKPGFSIYWKNQSYANGGAHGYDPTFKDMHAIFYATGPAFKKSFVHQSIENVNLYALFAEILNLNPANTDGHLKNVKGLLAD